MALALAYLSNNGNDPAFHEIILLIIPVACAWIAILVMFTVLTLLFCQWSFIHSRISLRKSRVLDPELQRFTNDPQEVSYDEALYSDGETCCDPSDEGSSEGANRWSYGEMNNMCAGSCGSRAGSVSCACSDRGGSCGGFSEMNCESINGSELGLNSETDWGFSGVPRIIHSGLSAEFSVTDGSDGGPSGNTTPNESDGGEGAALVCGNTARAGGHLSPTEINDITHRIRLAVPLREAMQLGMCWLCSQETLPMDQIRILPCNHSYHNLCILKYLIFYDMSCPHCREPIPLI